MLYEATITFFYVALQIEQSRQLLMYNFFSCGVKLFLAVFTFDFFSQTNIWFNMPFEIVGALDWTITEVAFPNFLSLFEVDFLFVTFYSF